jgi:hypothetical protein
MKNKNIKIHGSNAKMSQDYLAELRKKCLIKSTSSSLWLSGGRLLMSM